MGMASTSSQVDDFGCSPSESCTDASEDSVEVRVRPVSLPSASYSSGNGRRNKRKPAEPRRVTGGKRFRWDSDSDCSTSAAVAGKGKNLELEPESDAAESDAGDVEEGIERRGLNFTSVTSRHLQQNDQNHRHIHSETQTHRTNGSPRVEPSPLQFPPPRTARGCVSTVGESSGHSSHRSGEESGRSAGNFSGKQKQRNYKNMTRERRIEANARERTRVHTISAAFESLRRAVPAYSCNQKLSKLAILRIACSYILALASLNDIDYSHEQDNPSFAECVDLCTQTIQNEGRARRRRVSQELKKMKNKKSGSGTEDMKRWPYFSALSFIVPSLQAARTQFNLE